MNIIKDLSMKTMTPEKRKSSKHDYFAFYIGRPISYIFTVPFLKLNISPNTVSFISLFPPIVGFVFIGFINDFAYQVVGWLCFFLWNLLDGVDGNIARYTAKSSRLGVLWDATSGYAAMTFSFLAIGMAAFNNANSLPFFQPYIYLLMGALSAIFCLFSRLVMHKKMVIFSLKSVANMNVKESYKFHEIIMLNITSVSGFMQVIMLLAIILRWMDIFTIFYFCLNALIMLVAMFRLFNGGEEN